MHVQQPREIADKARRRGRMGKRLGEAWRPLPRRGRSAGTNMPRPSSHFCASWLGQCNAHRVASESCPTAHQHFLLRQATASSSFQPSFLASLSPISMKHKTNNQSHLKATTSAAWQCPCQKSYEWRRSSEHCPCCSTVQRRTWEFADHPAKKRRDERQMQRHQNNHPSSGSHAFPAPWPTCSREEASQA